MLFAPYLLPFLYFKPGPFQPSSNWLLCHTFLFVLVHSPCCLCNSLKTLNMSLPHIKNFSGNLSNRPGIPHSLIRSLYFSLWSAIDISALYSVCPCATNITAFCLEWMSYWCLMISWYPSSESCFFSSFWVIPASFCL